MNMSNQMMRFKLFLSIHAGYQQFEECGFYCLASVSPSYTKYAPPSYRQWWRNSPGSPLFLNVSIQSISIHVSIYILVGSLLSSLFFFLLNSFSWVLGLCVFILMFSIFYAPHISRLLPSELWLTF